MATDSSFPRQFGKYLLIDRVAEGGMAEIYLAVEISDVGWRRFVTIKRIRAEHCEDPDYLEFFLTEGRVSLQCSHPNLPLAFDLGEVDGSYYLAMEYIHGHTLLDALRGGIRARTYLSPALVLGVGLSVSAALEHAHGLCDVSGDPLRIVHRDVTPQNIMITTAGMVKLIDFGIAQAAIQLHKTAEGIVKGKFAYMAPEQLEESPRIDHRADLFALGVVLWEALAARPLFRGQDALATVQKVRHHPVPPIVELRPDVPPPLSAVIARALERDPAHRYQSATELLRAFERVCEHVRPLPTTTRIRDEIAELCGVPEPPSMPADTQVSDPPLMAAGSETSTVPRAPSSGLSGDPLLEYFLLRGRAKLPPAAAQQPDVASVEKH